MGTELYLFIFGDWNRISLEVYQSCEADEKGILPLNWKSVMNNVCVWIAPRLGTTSLTTMQIPHYTVVEVTWVNMMENIELLLQSIVYAS